MTRRHLFPAENRPPQGAVRGMARRAAAFLAVLLTSLSLVVAAPAPVPALAAPAQGSGAIELPPGFAIKPGPAGSELVWSGSKVAIGGARPEFRLAGDLLGYPREEAGALHLPLTAALEARLTAAGSTLEVWSSGRRLDRAPSASRAAAAAAGYDSTPTVTPTVNVDPAAPGRYRTQRSSYDLAALPFSEFPAPLEVKAEVTEPLQAGGKRPLVLILHGRHAPCFRGGPTGESSGGWPCPAGWAPIPSHEGYRYIADALASQGYLVVSIAANGINGQDFASADGGAAARSALIRHHLALWARWTARGGDPFGGRFKGKVDLDKVVLVGHSRGGEGVNRAAIDASANDPFRIVGILSIGPTAFGRQVTPDVHSATILPSCDGDVADLQGQAYIDASRDVAPSTALRSAVTAMGANHNFFNTEWTPGLAQAPANDDWFDPGDPTCGDNGSVRLTAAQQQVVGAAYTAALVRLAVDQDKAMLPLLDGSFVKPAVIGKAEVAVSAVGGPASLLYRPEDDGAPELQSGMTGRECPGFVVDPTSPSGGGPACGDGFETFTTPHWQPQFGLETRPAPVAMELAWPAAGAVARFPLSARGRDLSEFDTIDARVANDPNLAPAGLDLRVRDARGRTAVLNGALRSIDGWPGTELLDRIQARTLRGDLRSVRQQVDLEHIVSVELVTSSASGRVWVLDVAATRARIERPEVLDLPQVSVATITVPEGDAAGRAEVTISLDRPLRRPGRVWVQSTTFGADGSPVTNGFPLDLPAGSRSVVARVPVTWVGDDLYSQVGFGRFPLNGGQVTLGAISGVLTGGYVGGATTIEDEPAPVLSVTAAAVTAAEGQSLRWTFRLSAPTTGSLYVFTAKAPAGAELDTADVDPDWLSQWLFPVPASPVPLSQAQGFLGSGVTVLVFFDPGATESVLEIPIPVDQLTEGSESVRFDVVEFFGDDPTVPAAGLTLTGTVSGP